MKTESKKFLDTNILIYAEDSRNQRKHEIAKGEIKKYIEEKTGVISLQILTEFSNVLCVKSKEKIEASYINATIFDYSNIFITLIHNLRTVQEANKISRESKVHFYDALIAATLKENNIDTIITENEKDFKKIKWLKVINPFKS